MKRIISIIFTNFLAMFMNVRDFWILGSGHSIMESPRAKCLRLALLIFLLSIVSFILAALDIENSHALHLQDYTPVTENTDIKLNLTNFVFTAGYENTTSCFKNYNSLSFRLKASLTIVTCIMTPLVVYYQHLQRHSDNKRAPTVGIDYYFYFITLCDATATFLHIPPYADCILLTEYQSFVLIRIYHLSKVIQQQCRLNFTTVGKILFGFTQIDRISTLKVVLLKRPLTCILFVYLFCVFYISYFTFVIERCAHKIHSSFRSDTRYNDWINIVWMIAISITSLGFGDVVPTTHFGRFIVSGVSVIGVVMVGIFISTVQSRMMVSEVEKRIFYNVRMKKLKTLKTEAAANLG